MGADSMLEDESGLRLSRRVDRALVVPVVLATFEDEATNRSGLQPCDGGAEADAACAVLGDAVSPMADHRERLHRHYRTASRTLAFCRRDSLLSVHARPGDAEVLDDLPEFGELRSLDRHARIR